VRRITRILTDKIPPKNTPNTDHGRRRETRHRQLKRPPTNANSPVPTERTSSGELTRQSLVNEITKDVSNLLGTVKMVTATADGDTTRQIMETVGDNTVLMNGVNVLTKKVEDLLSTWEANDPEEIELMASLRSKLASLLDEGLTEPNEGTAHVDSKSPTLLSPNRASVSIQNVANISSIMTGMFDVLQYGFTLNEEDLAQAELVPAVHLEYVGSEHIYDLDT